jgi:hypothetical protein
MSKLQINVGQIFGNEAVKGQVRSLTAKAKNTVNSLLNIGGPEAEKLALQIRDKYVKDIKSLYAKVDPDKPMEAPAKKAPAKKAPVKKAPPKKKAAKPRDTDVSDIVGETGN